VAATDALKKRTDEVGQVMPHWTREEVLAVLVAAKTEPDLDLFLHLAIHTGLRHGEILGLTWVNVDLESRTMLVAQTLREVRQIDEFGSGKVILAVNPPKTKASRRVLHISDPLMAAFARHTMTQGIRKLQAGQSWRESNFVFTTSIGTPVSQANNLKRFKRFIDAHGFRYVRVHDIRHTTAVLALEAGASLEWISQAFGHTGVEITKTVYAPYVQALNDKFVDALDKYLATDEVSDEITWSCAQLGDMPTRQYSHGLKPINVFIPRYPR
jgi:integrase